MNFSGTPFSFSNENKLTAVGCDDAAFILRSPNSNSEGSGANEFIASCVAICSKNGDLSNGFCSGIGCCQASIPKGFHSIYYYMETLHGRVHEHDNLSACSFSFLAEPDSYTFNISDIFDPSFLWEDTTATARKDTREIHISALAVVGPCLEPERYLSFLHLLHFKDEVELVVLDDGFYEIVKIVGEIIVGSVEVAQ